MVEITTVSVAPNQAERLRQIRDDGEFKNMDQTLGAVLDRWEQTSG